MTDDKRKIETGQTEVIERIAATALRQSEAEYEKTKGAQWEAAIKAALERWIRILSAALILLVLFNAGPAVYFNLRCVNFWFALLVAFLASEIKRAVLP